MFKHDPALAMAPASRALRRALQHKRRYSLARMNENWLATPILSRRCIDRAGLSLATGVCGLFPEGQSMQQKR